MNYIYVQQSTPIISMPVDEFSHGENTPMQYPLRLRSGVLQKHSMSLSSPNPSSFFPDIKQHHLGLPIMFDFFHSSYVYEM